MSNLLNAYPTVFVDNKYLHWYEKLTSNPSVGGYLEKHHIVPKSIVPNTSLISLTARQHYIAHLLLIKCVTPKYKRKMLYALTAMKMRTIKGIKFNSRLFETFKIEANKNRREALTGRKHSAETKEKIKAKRALQTISNETKLKMSAAHKGKKNSPEAIEKTRQAHIGSKRSDETKQRLIESRQYYPRIKCEHCGMEVVTVNYNRWHGNNCKKRINDEF
jgi:hypothetical protein